MPLPVLTVDIRLGDTVTQAEVLQDKLADLRPFFESQADPIVRTMWGQMFATEGKSTGTPWASLSPVTLGLKAAANRERMGVLQFSRSLYQSLVSRSDAEGVKVVERRTAVFGTRVPYAHHHQDGWTMRSFMGRPVAARSILPRKLVPPALPAGTLEELRQGVVRYLTTGAL